MLTIEELKALEVGDWVWIAYSKNGESCYEKIAGTDKTRVLFYGSDLSTTFATYGTKWLAFKNKEEAEGKSITLPYLLCTSSKFACVIWRDKDGKVHKTYTMPIDEAKGVLKEKERLCHINE